MAELVECENIVNIDETFDFLQEDIRNLHQDYILKSRELQQLGLDPSVEGEVTKKSSEMMKMQLDIQSKTKQLDMICKDAGDADTLKKFNDFEYEMMILGLSSNFQNLRVFKSQLAESEQFLNEFKLMKNQVKKEIEQHDCGQLSAEPGSEAAIVNGFVDLLSDTVEKSNEETVEDVMQFSLKFMQMAMLKRLNPANDSAISVVTSNNMNDANDESNSQGAMSKSNQESSDFTNMVDDFIELLGGSNQAPSEIMEKMEFISMASMLAKSRISDETADHEV